MLLSRRRVLTLGGAAALCAAVGSCGGSGTQRPPEPETPSPLPLPNDVELPSLPWSSGMFPAGNTRTASRESYLAAVRHDEQARGRRCDVEEAAQWHDSWQAVRDVGVLDFMDPDRTAIVDLPPFPYGGSEVGSWAGAASGQYDDHYRALGASVAAKRGGQQTVLRLAWEFNGDWYGHRADPSFVAGWQRAVSNIRTGAADRAGSIRLSWSLAALDSSAGFEPLAQLWPGDDYVDIVGVDVYDLRPRTTPERFGPADVLDKIYAFAQGHGKPFALDEWGLHHATQGKYAGEGGGDNPLFIRDMYSWIDAHQGGLAYEIYFQDDAPDNVNSSLFSPRMDANPRSREAYLAVMRNNGTPAPEP